MYKKHYSKQLKALLVKCWTGTYPIGKQVKNIHRWGDRKNSQKFDGSFLRAEMTWKHSGYIYGLPDVRDACDLTY